MEAEPRSHDGDEAMPDYMSSPLSQPLHADGCMARELLHRASDYHCRQGVTSGTRFGHSPVVSPAPCCQGRYACPAVTARVAARATRPGAAGSQTCRA